MTVFRPCPAGQTDTGDEEHRTKVHLCSRVGSQIINASETESCSLPLMLTPRQLATQPEAPHPARSLPESLAPNRLAKARGLL